MNRKVRLTIPLLLVGLLAGAVLLGARALLRRAKPPDRSVTAAASASVAPESAPAVWERLTVRDVEEALEETDGTEDTLRILRSRLEAHAQERQLPPMPALRPPAPQGAPLPALPATPISVQATGEPTVREVQRAAIRYAEVMPEKIGRWRTLAQLRNLIPRFTVGLDRDSDTTIASSSSAGKTTFTVGPQDESVSLDFGFTWDLANLVWDSAQTSIDTRSRLMVQLRKEVLENVTQLYFERQRLRAEFQANPTEDPILQRERSLRIEELTAQLDALTGGLYSDGP